jgi:signal transduction histidine kinase
LLKRLSFSSQFLVFSLLVLVVGMVTLGVWMQNEIQRVVTGRTAHVTSLFVDSFVAHHAVAIIESDSSPEEDIQALNLHLSTDLGREIVTFKLWSQDGTIVYSTSPALIGRTFEAEDELLQAFGGDVVSHLTDLTGPANVEERQFGDTLIETYAPVWNEDTGRVIAVAEFYQQPHALVGDIRRAQLRGWMFLAGATVLMYLLLVGITRRVSRVIRSQSEEVEATVKDLSQLLKHNQHLRERMGEAAEAATALNERYLHEIAADLHDGPAQHVSLALLRLEDLNANEGHDTAMTRSALETALADLRSIARGLRLPEIAQLSPEATIRRAVRDFERLTGTRVTVRCENLPAVVPLATKITIYRVLQEALSNSFRHADGNGAVRTVAATSAGGDLVLEIADTGPGFDVNQAMTEKTLGIKVMRERVEMLGGRLEIDSSRETGTRIDARLPIRQAEL